MAGEVIIIAHFDAHGVATGAARARLISAGSKLYARYPYTGPEKLPEFIDTFWGELMTAERVEIIDIPVNLRDPRTFMEALNRLARNVPVIYVDHHLTDAQYTPGVESPIRWLIFPDAEQMAYYLGLTPLLPGVIGQLALIGIVADRDISVLRRVPREQVERELLPLANALDVLVRQDTQGTADALVAVDDPIAWLREQARAIEYPPYSLAEQVSIRKRSHVAVLADFTDLEPRTYSAWTWKTMEQLALRERRPYVVAMSMYFDRQTQRYVPCVQVIRYWLATDRPSPRPLVERVTQGRTMIGHEDAFSIRCLDEADMVQLAEQVFQSLTTPSSAVSRLISEPAVAQAVETDYTRIIRFLERIASALERGAEAKEEQVSLLRELYHRDERTRVD